MSNLVHNEKVKLQATYINNLGVATFVAGIFGFIAMGRSSIWMFLLALSIGLSGSVSLHFIAKKCLNALQE